MSLIKSETATLAIPDMIEKQLSRMRRDFEQECKDFVFAQYQPPHAYDSSIEYYQNLINTTTGFERQMYEEEIKPFIRDKLRTIDFEERFEARRKELEIKYYQPTKYATTEVVKYINDSHQEMLDFIFESFVDKVKKLCPEDKDYEQTIKSVYDNKYSQKVIDVFESLRGNLLRTFTELIKACDNPLKLSDTLQMKMFNLYADMEGEIEDLINTQPDKQMSSSRLVKSYSQSLLSSIHQFIINVLSKMIQERLQEIFEDLGITSQAKLESASLSCASSEPQSGSQAKSDANTEQVMNAKQITTTTPLIEEVDNDEDDSDSLMRNSTFGNSANRLANARLELCSRRFECERSSPVDSSEASGCEADSNEVREVEDVTDKVEQQQPQPTSIHTFIQTLPINIEVLADDMLKLYNKHTNTNTTKIAFGKLLASVPNIVQVRRTVNKNKLTFYMRT